MVKLKKNQKVITIKGREVGIIIDCEEITISIFAPPREHGKPHCHVRAKKSRKVKGKEIYPEVKVYLDGTGIVIVTEGFSARDLEIIANILFNDPEGNLISNDEYLINKWKELHYGKSKKK